MLTEQKLVHEGLLKALMDSPEDFALWGVLGDYFEEQGGKKMEKLAELCHACGVKKLPRESNDLPPVYYFSFKDVPSVMVSFFANNLEFHAMAYEAKRSALISAAWAIFKFLAKETEQ